MGIKNWELGEYGEYIDDYHNHRMVENMIQLCVLPAPAAVEWVKSDPEIKRALPKVECFPCSMTPGNYNVMGWMNKGFVVVSREYWRAFAIYHHDYTFRLVEIRFKKIFSE